MQGKGGLIPTPSRRRVDQARAPIYHVFLARTMRASSIKSFSPPLVVRQRNVFGTKHLHNLHQTAGLPSLLELGRTYLSVGELEAAHKCFTKICNLCLLAPAHPIPMLFASSCVGLARVLVAHIAKGGGINGSMDCRSMAERVLSLLNQAIVHVTNLTPPRSFSEKGPLGLTAETADTAPNTLLHQLFLGQAMGCLSELLATLPEFNPLHAASVNEPQYTSSVPLQEKIADTYVQAVALCIVGVHGKDVWTDPYSGYDWRGDAIADLCRMNKNIATFPTPAGVDHPTIVSIAEDVVALALEKFGTRVGHSVVAQAFHDLGKIHHDRELCRHCQRSAVGSQCTCCTSAAPVCVSPVALRKTRAILCKAQHLYAQAGIWKGSTDYVDCLADLSSSAVHAVEGVENARAASSEAVKAIAWEVHQHPQSTAAVQGVARALGVYGRVAGKSGAILDAVGVASGVSEMVVWGGRGQRGQRRMSDGTSEWSATTQLNRHVAAVWAVGPRGQLPAWSPSRGATNQDRNLAARTYMKSNKDWEWEEEKEWKGKGSRHRVSRVWY